MQRVSVRPLRAPQQNAIVRQAPHILMVDPGSSPFLPQANEDDTAYAIVRATLGLATGGVAGELFALLFTSPLQRRTEEWMRQIARTLARVERRIPGRLRELLASEDFATMVIATTQVAARNSHEARRRLLASAIAHAAAGSQVELDRQLLFVRFVDELTSSHVALLRQLSSDSEYVGLISGYPELLRYFKEKSGLNASEDELTLLCNDLSALALVRFGPTLDPFPGLATQDALVTEGSDMGPRIVTTALARDFLAYVDSPPV